MRLEGKVALVTGAADERSIGWGIAQALADEGADMVVNDVARPDDLNKRAGLPYEMGRTVVYFASPDGDYVTGAFLRVDGGLGVGKD